MRKSFILIAMFIATLFVGSCTQCSKNTTLNVEKAISMDREKMLTDCGDNYKWFETGVVLKDYLDEENDGTIEMVVNVFQNVVEKEDGLDTFVTKFQHTLDGVTSESVHGFWIEDFALNDEDIKITFAKAYETVMEVNLPKPHSKHVVLRKQIGPKACNPQWIFGNITSQIYVDAVTGEVNSKNPAFDEINLVDFIQKLF